MKQTKNKSKSQLFFEDKLPDPLLDFSSKMHLKKKDVNPIEIRFLVYQVELVIFIYF